MNAQMGPEGGAVLRRSVEALGIRVHTGSRTTAILGADKVQGVRLRDRPDIECDMVVVAAGIRPNVEVAVTSGLRPSWWTTTCECRTRRRSTP
jgi:nitrite reductase (NADH) large subunit